MTPEEREDKKLEIESEKLHVEKRKLRIEYWKLLATILIPLAGIITITFQLNSQEKLKERELESNLLIQAMDANDNDSSLRKLVYSGALDNTSKFYSFLIEDTIVIDVPQAIFSKDTSVQIRQKDISKWMFGNTKNLCNGAKAVNCKCLVYSNGLVEFSFDVQPSRLVKVMTPTVILADSNQVELGRLKLPPISIPSFDPHKDKRVVYQSYYDVVEKKFDKIGWTFTDWNCN